MITLPEYQVMGENGVEYGPVSAEQVRVWIGERRLDAKTPVKPAGVRDWVFLESLPEFAAAFQSPAPRPKRHWWPWAVAIGIILAAGAIFWELKKIHHH